MVIYYFGYVSGFEFNYSSSLNHFVVIFIRFYFSCLQYNALLLLFYVCFCLCIFCVCVSCKLVLCCFVFVKSKNYI